MLPLSAILSFMRVGLVSHKTIVRMGRRSAPAVMRVALAAAVGVTAGTALAQTQIATTAMLSVTSGGAAVTTVTSGSVVTLTATVTAGAVVVTPGQVNFCDASVTYCTDIHRIGTAQLTSQGTAILKFVPSIGSHSYVAVFMGTPNGTPAHAGSTSSSATFTVTGTYPTTTTITQSGTAGNYTLSATVTGSVNATGPAAPGGTVSFLDTSTNSAVLGTGSLGTATQTTNWTSSVPLVNTPESASSGDGVPTVADFNGDGIPDLAIVKDNDLVVWLGDGSGNFTQVSDTPTTGANNPIANPQLMKVGDFNDDGKLDVAVGVGDSSVTMFLGNGDGTFRQAPNSPFSLPNYVSSLWTVGDFNGDGQLDLLIAVNSGPTVNQVQVLFGNGDGTFSTISAATSFGTADDNQAIFGVADFNGDGKLDILTTPSSYGDPGYGIANVLFGNGDGTFTPTTLFNNSITGYVTAGEAADFNGDGKEDFVISSYPNYLTFFLGNGDGTFTQSTQSMSGFSGNAILAIADFNGDGKVDLVASSGGGPNTLFELLGNGDGTFAPQTLIPDTIAVRGVSSGHLRGDTASDLVEIGNNEIQVLSPRLTQTATATVTSISPLGSGTHQIEASYPGDISYASSTSTTIGLTAQPAAPTVSVVVSSSTITNTQPLTVTVSVSGSANNPIPTGSVSLTSGSFSSGNAALNNSNTTINIPAGSLAAGNDTLTVSYTGDANYIAAAGSASVSVTVIPPGFTITDTPVTITAPGATTANTSTVTVMPVGGFGGSVALTATITSSPSGAQNPPTVSFGSSSPLSVTTNGAATATLTITTTPATTSAMAHPTRRGDPWLTTRATAFACVLLFAIRGKPRRWPSILGVVALSIALTTLAVGCSSGTKSTGGSSISNPGTTAGTYNITITGTSGSLTATSTVAVTVQ